MLHTLVGESCELVGAAAAENSEGFGHNAIQRSQLQMVWRERQGARNGLWKTQSKIIVGAWTELRGSNDVMWVLALQRRARTFYVHYYDC